MYEFFIPSNHYPAFLNKCIENDNILQETAYLLGLYINLKM